MAHSSSPHSTLASPPRYEKSSINQRNNCLRYDERDPAPRYSSKNPSPNSYQAVRAEAETINGLLCTSADDKLPPYAPTLQLLTLCRRKNELDAKDRKAKKRSWDLVWLLLDGTALRMYQPTTPEAKKFEKEWNEKYCSKGPVKEVVAPPVEQEEETDEEVEVEEVLDVHSTLLGERRRTNRPSHGRGRSSSTAKTPFEPTPTPSPSTSRPAPPRIRTSHNMPSPTSALNPSPTTLSSPTRSFLQALNIPPHPSLPTILTRKPSISHPVRNISCTRATTYFKRYFVLCFVLEDGKQFLVQLNSHEETLVWQQIVTIAAPLALDIDERDMPEPAPYPRPRRRTAAPAPSSSSSSSSFPVPTPATAPTLVRRPSTAPGTIDTSRIPNVPPEYETSPPPATASMTHVDGGMRRQRSFSGL